MRIKQCSRQIYWNYKLSVEKGIALTPSVDLLIIIFSFSEEHRSDTVKILVTKLRSLGMFFKHRNYRQSHPDSYRESSFKQLPDNFTVPINFKSNLSFKLSSMGILSLKLKISNFSKCRQFIGLKTGVSA